MVLKANGLILKMLGLEQDYQKKIGGWSKVVPTKKIAGVARASTAWVSLTGVRHLALGTDRKLYIYTEGVFYDVTPIRLEAALTGPFAMTSGSPTVTVTHNSHGAGVGDFVTFDSFSTAQGLDMNNEFEVTSVVDGNNYTVNSHKQCQRYSKLARWIR